MTPKQRALLFATLTDLTIVARDDYLRACSHITSTEITSTGDLTAGQYEEVIGHLLAVQSWPEEERLVEVDILTRPVKDPWAQDKPAA